METSKAKKEAPEFKMFVFIPLVELKGEDIVGPGLPPCVRDTSPFISEDCVKIYLSVIWDLELVI